MVPLTLGRPDSAQNSAFLTQSGWHSTRHADTFYGKEDLPSLLGLSLLSAGMHTAGPVPASWLLCRSEGSVPGFINPVSQDSAGFHRLSTGTLLPAFMFAHRPCRMEIMSCVMALKSLEFWTALLPPHGRLEPQLGCTQPALCLDFPSQLVQWYLKRMMAKIKHLE